MEFPIFGQITLSKKAALSYKFIYFDLDDTLLDHKAAEVAALEEVYTNFSLFSNIRPQTLTDVYHHVNSGQWTLYSRGEVTRSELQRNRFEKTLQQLELDASMHREVGDYYLQCYRNHWKWIEGAELMFQKVCKQFPVGLLTNGFAETQRLKFEKFDLHTSTQYTVISEEIGALKPDPKVFRHATDLVGVGPEEILYVGDSYTSDIEGGAAFGWSTAWYTNRGTSKQHNLADFVFNDFKDLCNFLGV